MNVAHPDIETILLSREQIARRVAELGAEITRDYRGCNLVLLGVLKGSVVFLADLMRAISVPLRFDVVRAASYGGAATSSGEVKIVCDLGLSLDGADVLVVEDILDTGRTIAALQRELRARGALNIDLCVFLAKKRKRAVAVTPRYVGFEIPDRFVVGYGLDYDERYRDLEYVGILKPSVYAK